MDPKQDPPFVPNLPALEAGDPMVDSGAEPTLEAATDDVSFPVESGPPTCVANAPGFPACPPGFGCTCGVMWCSCVAPEGGT